MAKYLFKYFTRFQYIDVGTAPQLCSELKKKLNGHIVQNKQYISMVVSREDWHMTRNAC